MDAQTQEKYNQLKKDLQMAKEGADTCGQLYGVYNNIKTEFEEFCREYNISPKQN
jgi:hypothetical protein